MDDSDKRIIEFYKTRIEPFIAIFILAFLITGLVLLYQDNQLKEDIKNNCGYETKDYVCYCESKIVDEQMRLQQGVRGLDVQLDWNNYSESSD